MKAHEAGNENTIRCQAEYHPKTGSSLAKTDFLCKVIIHHLADPDFAFEKVEGKMFPLGRTLSFGSVGRPVVYAYPRFPVLASILLIKIPGKKIIPCKFSLTVSSWAG